MATVFRKTFTKPLPATAEIIVRDGKRVARWKDTKGRTRTAPLTTGRDGKDRITVTARTFTAKFRDGQNILCEVATGCRDEQAARAVLARLEKRSENVKSGIVTVADDAVIDRLNTPLREHFTAYHDHQRAKRLNPIRLSNTTSRLKRLASECRWEKLGDLSLASM